MCMTAWDSKSTWLGVLPKINVSHCDLHFVIQWFSYIWKTMYLVYEYDFFLYWLNRSWSLTWGLIGVHSDLYWRGSVLVPKIMKTICCKVIVIYNSWLSDFSSSVCRYSKDLHHTWIDGLGWHYESYFRSVWPIFWFSDFISYFKTFPCIFITRRSILRADTVSDLILIEGQCNIYLWSSEFASNFNYFTYICIILELVVGTETLSDLILNVDHCGLYFKIKWFSQHLKHFFMSMQIPRLKVMANFVSDVIIIVGVLDLCFRV